jgi:hypothetical protein
MLQSRLRFRQLVPHASANSELTSQTTNVIGNCQDPPNGGYSHHTSTATDHSLFRVSRPLRKVASQQFHRSHTRLNAF